jgi:hypothetical protein
MDEEAARRYRQRVFQMGLLVCLFLLFVDQRGAVTTGNGAYGDASSGNTGAANGSSSALSPSAGGHGGGLDDNDWVVQGVPEAQTARLNQFLQLQPWDGGFYPRNVTGVYRGLWSKNVSSSEEAAAAAAAAAAVAAAEGQEAEVEKAEEDGKEKEKEKLSVQLREEGGRFDMPLFMASIPGVEGLSAVYGYFRLFDGEASTDRDVYAVTKGACAVVVVMEALI